MNLYKIMEPTSPIPADLTAACHLGLGEYDSFGVVFFRRPSSSFYHKDPAMGTVSMVGVSREKATTVAEAIKHLPAGANEPSDTFYARQESGEYFHISNTLPGETSITPIASDRVLDLRKYEEAGQFSMAKGAIRTLAVRQDIKALDFFIQNSAGTYPVPLFDLSQPEFSWLFSHPEQLKKFGAASTYDQEPNPVLLAAIKDWPETEIQVFFHNPRRFGHELTHYSLEKLARNMEACHVPAIVRAGTLPTVEDATMCRLNPTTQEAFRLEEQKLLQALGSPKTVEKLLIQRRAYYPTKELAALEDQVSKAHRSAPAVPRLSGTPAAEIIQTPSSQIGR
jgi:hypothetical protein